ncbi:MAG: hypothetical protein ACRDRZ_02375 [Pseudonocardiaceae bacterium]
MAAVLGAGGLVIAISVIAVTLTLTPFALVCMSALVFAALRRRRRWLQRWQEVAAAGPTAQAVTPPAQVVTPPPADWVATRARFGHLQQEYARFECDPLAVLHTPALADVTVPSTARFVAAFAEAQALDADVEPPAEHRARFAAAVDQAVRAWVAARDAAERIRLAGIPEAERATVQRAIKLLTVARDATHDTERSAAYAKARAELAKLDRNGTLRLPRPAAAALEAAARSQLPSSSQAAS